MGKSVVFDGAPNRCCYRGKLVVGEVNCRPGPDSIGRHCSARRLRAAGGPRASAVFKAARLALAAEGNRAAKKEHAAGLRRHSLPAHQADKCYAIKRDKLSF